MSLLDRLRAATGPDRELDWLVHGAIYPWNSGRDWQPFGYVDVDGQQPHPDQVSYVKDGRWFYMDLPRYTASVDACLALVGEKLPGWAGVVDFGGDAAMRRADLWGPIKEMGEDIEGAPVEIRDEADGEAPTPALALLTALVAAMGEE